MLKELGIIHKATVPHAGRVTPSADDVYSDLAKLFRSFDKESRKRRAVKILMGDCNGRLARAYNFTGKRRPSARSEAERESRAAEVLPTALGLRAGVAEPPHRALGLRVRIAEAPE